MGQRSSHGRIRELFAYMYVMVTGVFVLAAIVLLSLFSLQDVELDVRDRVMLYHLKSSAIARELRQEVSELEHIFFPHEHTDADSTHVREMHATVDQKVLLTSIEINVSKLSELQDQYGGEEFRATLDRIDSRVRQISSFVGSPPTREQADNFTRSFEHAVLQLAMLHTVAAEKALEQLPPGAP